MTSLWASSAFLLPQGSSEILGRTKNTPLVVDLLTSPLMRREPKTRFLRPYQFSETYLKLLSEHLYMAQIIFLPPVVLSKCLNALEAKDFPFLHRVKLVSGTDHPLQITLGKTPLLSHLSMHNCVVSCDYSTIISLHMHFEHRLNIHGIINPIRLATNLRSLTLVGHRLSYVSTSAHISLPHLKDLHLDAPSDFCASLWDILTIAPGARMTIHIDSRLLRALRLPESHLAEAAVQRKVDFMGTVAHHYDQVNAPRIGGIRLECSITRIVLFRQDLCDDTRKLRSTPYHDNDIALDVHMAQMDILPNTSLPAPLALAEQIARHVPLSYPITLELFKPGRYSTAHWRQSLIHLDTVHILLLDEFPPLEELWDAVCPSISISTTGREVIPVLPRLQVVHIALQSFQWFDIRPVISGGDWDRWSYGSGDAVYNLPVGSARAVGVGQLDADASSLRPAPWASFLAGLKRRSDQGYGIQKVVLGPFRGYTTSETFSQLREDLSAVVPEVVEIPQASAIAY
ncbi:hypothetical protein PENSPDRAFT_751538 [Peniophora sp. CONT]|nr:hypothetical protein PENSPDRAFT_751538 [Peniophora sp. CONT]